MRFLSIVTIVGHKKSRCIITLSPLGLSFESFCDTSTRQICQVERGLVMHDLTGFLVLKTYEADDGFLNAQDLYCLVLFLS